MAPMGENHSHRSTTKISQKPFKSRHATKGLIKDLSKGKVEQGVRGSRKTPHQQVMSKIDRRHKASQKRQIKHLENVKSTSVFSGQNGAPRIVAIIPLCGGCDAKAAVQALNFSVAAETSTSFQGPIKARIDRFKQNVVYLPVNHGMFTALDVCRVADFVIFLLSPNQEPDEEGEVMLKAIESQGISNVLTMVQGLDKVEPPKRHPQIVASLKSYITHFFPSQEKVHSLDSERECANVIRSLCTMTPKGVKWREDRSWMLAEDLQWPEKLSGNEEHGEVVITGVVRGKSLKADRLLQVGDWGQYQIEKITDASLSVSRKRKADEMAIDAESKEETILEVPDGEQDDLAELAPYDIAMDDVDDLPISEALIEKRGVLLDDHHYFSDDETHLPEAPKRLPKGTSNYQAAWFLGDMSDSGSDIEDDEDGDQAMDAPALPQDGLEGLDQATQRDPTEMAPSEYPQSEAFLDPSPDDEAAQLAEYRSQRKTEAEEDLEFPDEIELHPKVLARERLARYRGLKSLKTSHWETTEDKAHEPEDWNRLLQISDYKSAKKQALRETIAGGVQPGKRVNVHLRNVPLNIRNSYDSTKPLALISNLLHEHKRAVVNFNITLSSDSPTPLKSKEEIIVQCGSRRFVINPLFSQTGNTRNNVHKFQRYLHPGQTAMATFIAPLTWGAVPALFFKKTAASEEDPPSSDTSPPQSTFKLIGTGTSQPPDRSRVIAKRVILTGHPYKIHKKLVTVRYMFFNQEDVKWFKALQLWTKRGRSGYIKESLGTHGYFKATFDGRINPQDAVGVSLYKRVFPRNARAWAPDESGKPGQRNQAETVEDAVPMLV